MLEDLEQTIETLKKRIRDHRADIQDYERRTRATLIDPMLFALGWDVSDPGAVTIEPKVENGWADYGLLGSNGKTVVMFVEAKKLADKDSPLHQMVSYAVTENIRNNANVRYCASTNGDAWAVYDISAQKAVMETSIATDDTAKCALKLLSLWRRSVGDGAIDAAVEPVVTPEPMPVAPPIPATSVSTPPHTGWTPLTAVLPAMGTPAPAALRHPDNQEVATKVWRDVIIETARWLYQTGRLTPENCLLASSSRPQPKRYILNRDRQHRDGEFVSPVRIADGIMLETNLSANDIVKHTQRMLEHYGQDPSHTYLKRK